MLEGRERRVKESKRESQPDSGSNNQALFLADCDLLPNSRLGSRLRCSYQPVSFLFPEKFKQHPGTFSIDSYFYSHFFFARQLKSVFQNMRLIQVGS